MATSDETLTRIKALGYIETSPGVFARPQKSNAQAVSQLCPPQPKCDVGKEPLDFNKAQAGGPGRIKLQITIYRKRTLDADNLAGGCKYLVDGLRYAGIIPDDAPEQISFQVEQEKVKEKSQEKTVIELTYP